MDIPPLDRFGPRLCILGPSNAGKSTLAVKLGRKLEMPVVHLDQLHHQPHTDWKPRPAEEFAGLHTAALTGDRWVMEGNYMGHFETRAARATGIIILGTSRWAALGRYFRRTLFEQDRIGILEGASDRLKLGMMRFILFEQPGKRQRDLDMAAASGLPCLILNTMAALNEAYRHWDL